MSNEHDLPPDNAPRQSKLPGDLARYSSKRADLDNQLNMSNKKREQDISIEQKIQKIKADF